MAATVQLRMYSSQLFSRYADVFVEEPEEIEVEKNDQPVVAALSDVVLNLKETGIEYWIAAAYHIWHVVKQGYRLTRRPATVVNFFQPC